MKDSSWKKFLPNEIVQKLEGKDNIVKIGANSFWLLSDKLLRMLITLFVTGWLARYLSVDEFGKLNNAIAYATLFGAFASLGLDSIVIRDIVRYPDKKDAVIGTSFYLKLFAGIITWILSALCVIILRPSPEESISRYLVYIISAGVLFQSFDVIDYYFQSQVKSKYTVFAKNSAFILISGVKIWMIWMKLPLIYFGWAWLAEMMMNAIGLIIVFQRRDHLVKKWIFDRTLAGILLRQSAAIYIAFIASYTYMKVDQIMISKMLNDSQAGLFAASAKLYDLCFFIIIILTPSFFPSLIHIYEKDKILFYKRYQQITNLFTLLGYSVLVFILIFGDLIIKILYGVPFVAASSILKIQIFGMLFMFNGGLRSSYLTITGKQRIIMFTSIMTAFLNIMLNYYLIPIYGIKGSAIATGISSVSAMLLFNIFFGETRKIFFIQAKSLLLFGLFIQLIKRKS